MIIFNYSFVFYIFHILCIEIYIFTSEKVINSAQKMFNLENNLYKYV